MNHNNVLEKIVIIDFGSQFTQLIARKLEKLEFILKLLILIKSEV